jgi:plasmid stabilization system protein ParE
MTCIVKGRARLDLKGHWQYIARDNVEAADRLLRAAEDTFNFIAEHPTLGSQRSFRKIVGVRSRAVTGFKNYLVFYQMRGERVVILRVLHGMRDLPRLFVNVRV